MHHTTAEVPLMPLGHESVPGTLCIQNVLATAHQTAGATLAGAPPTARLSKCTISSVTRAWSGMTTLKPRQRSTHVLEHAQTHHGIPLHTKDARNSTSDSARNSRARHPARPSKCTISSTVRARSGTPTHILMMMIIIIYHYRFYPMILIMIHYDYGIIYGRWQSKYQNENLEIRPPSKL